MRPEIAKMLDHIYVNPRLQNDKSVLAFEDIKGVERNLFFVDHNEEEVQCFLFYFYFMPLAAEKKKTL